jgi:hypothetical protein
MISEMVLIKALKRINILKALKRLKIFNVCMHPNSSVGQCETKDI